MITIIIVGILLTLPLYGITYILSKRTCLEEEDVRHTIQTELGSMFDCVPYSYMSSEYTPKKLFIIKIKRGIKELEDEELKKSRKRKAQEIFDRLEKGEIKIVEVSNE